MNFLFFFKNAIRLTIIFQYNIMNNSITKRKENKLKLNVRK